MPGLSDFDQVGWKSGHIFAYRQRAKPKQPSVIVYSPLGKLWLLMPTPSDTVNRLLASVSVAPDGTVITATLDNYGGLQGSLQVYRGDTTPLRVASLGKNELPYAVCMDDPKTTWLVTSIIARNREDASLDYDAGAELRNPDLPALELLGVDPRKREPAIPAVRRREIDVTQLLGRYPGDVMMTCSDGVVDFYHGPTGAFFEYDADTQVTLRWDLPEPLDTSLHTNGFAVTRSGEVFASVLSVNTKNEIERIALYRMVLKDSEAKWVEVPGTSSLYRNSRFGVLLGADGDDLIFVGPLKTPRAETIYRAPAPAKQ